MVVHGTYRSKMPHALLLAVMSAQISISSAFLPINADPIPTRSTSLADNQHLVLPREIRTARYTAADDSDNDHEDAADRKFDGLASLPPIGASSFWDRPEDVNANKNSDSARPKSSENSNNKNDIIISEHANLVSPKFQLQYTCKVCGHRNSHTVTRLAYRQGVVIAMCKGCLTKHWIADHLGWSNHVGGFDFDNGERDIEMYMENRDSEAREAGAVEENVSENDLVRRVNRDVFDLENILYKNPAENPLSAKDTGGDEKEKDWS